VPGLTAVSRRGRTAALVLAGYLLVAFAYLGAPALVEDGRRYVGSGYNPQIFIWSFAWWPHAILHGQNPFFTREVWSPDGVNTMWSTTVPGLSILFAPLTWVAGPILSYDVAAVLAPAVSAWTAFLLCRYLSNDLWASVVGGYLFGFSSYVLAEGGAGGNLNLSSVFLLPLAALVLLRFLDGGLSGRGVVVRLGPLLALQFLISVEVAGTLTLAIGVGLFLCVLVAGGRRHRVVSLLGPLAGAYGLAAVLVAPWLYYLLAAYPRGPFYQPDAFVADLANFVVPTKVAALGGGLLTGISKRFPGNLGEQGAYLGLPIVAIVVLFFLRNRLRTPGGRFLFASLLVGVVSALGGRGTVAGHYVATLPWALVRSVGPFQNILTVRFVAYVALVAAVVVALWTAGERRGVLRFALPGLAVAALVPNPVAGGFATRYHVPAFFTDRSYRGCLDPGETVLPLPVRGGNSLLWQVATAFRFRMAGGDIGPDIPSSFFTPPNDQITGGQPLRPSQSDALRSFVSSRGVASVVVDGDRAADFAPAADRLVAPHRIGGVLLYPVTAIPPSCPGS